MKDEIPTEFLKIKESEKFENKGQYNKKYRI